MPVEYDLEIQARFPAALCAIHNFTRDHESDIREPDNNGAHIDFGNYGGGQIEAVGLGADNEEVVAMRDSCRTNVRGLPELYTGSRGGGGGIDVQI